MFRWSRCSDWRSAARPVSAGFPDPAEISDQNHLVHASRHRRSPLKITVKTSPGLPSHAGRLQLQPVALSVILSDQRPNPGPSEATLYARRRCRLSVRSAIPGYPHIARPKPMFQFCSTQPHVIQCSLCASPKRTAKVEPGSSQRGRNTINKSLTCRTAFRPRVLHFGDGFFNRSGVWIVPTMRRSRHHENASGPTRSGQQLESGP